MQLGGTPLTQPATPDPATPDPGASLADQVRASVRAFAAAHPGPAVELRVPPYIAVQCIAGPGHKRGTPPNVVETDPRTWLALVAGRCGWGEAVADGRVRASGIRGDLSSLLPFLPPSP